MKFSKVLLAGSALAFGGVAMAATQGTLGTDSTGTADVTVIKENAVQISDVDDIDLGSHPVLAADATGSDDVCVFNSTGSYNVTVTSANNFSLDSTAGQSIAYAVTWAEVVGGLAGPAADATNGQLTGLTGDATAVDCSGGTNATFTVTVAQADFNAAAPGTYEDTLTMMVEPQ